MSDSQLWQIMWQQAGVGRFILALVCGVIVSVIYFMSLQWSVNRLGNEKARHRIKLFAGAAVLRIALFFGVLVLVAQKNILLIALYVVAFFVTKFFILWRAKKQWHAQIDVKSASHSTDGGADAAD